MYPDVAGRIYPDLLDSTTQNWLLDPANPAKVDGRVFPGEHAQGLMGLRPGTVVFSSSGQWKGESPIASMRVILTKRRGPVYYRIRSDEEY